MKNILIVFLLLFSPLGHSLVSVGGYVPFGVSTQKEADGGRNTFSMDPAVSVNTVMPAPYIGLFMPEFGMVFHGSGKDGYKKQTIFLLADAGYQIIPQGVLRYGVGTFITKIKGEGGVVYLNNGNGTDPFYKPSKSVSTYNTTLNLGFEHSFMAKYALRFETFMFSPLSSARKFSYILNLTYYL